ARSGCRTPQYPRGDGRSVNSRPPASRVASEAAILDRYAVTAPPAEWYVGEIAFNRPVCQSAATTRVTGTMKLFECQNCGQPLYFENTKCESCGLPLGYLPNQQTLPPSQPATAPPRTSP